MVDRIEKAFRKMSGHDRLEIGRMIARVLGRNFGGLDVKKLSGHPGGYRVRKGDYRIIFFMTPTDVRVIAVERHSESTYG
jgi:mRNA-degrading endonuclease RelE of RelBE toxin-antitoxin system